MLASSVAFAFELDTAVDHVVLYGGKFLHNANFRLLLSSSQRACAIILVVHSLLQQQFANVRFFIT